MAVALCVDCGKSLGGLSSEPDPRCGQCKTTRRAKWMAKALRAEGDLSEWEEGFVQSVSERLESGRHLTENQYQKLEQIYEK